MQGWRCKIGLVLPIDNAVIEPELRNVASPGVTYHGARLHTMELSEMPTDGEEEAKNLGKMGADVIAYACNASSFYGGPGYDKEIAERLSNAAGVPATTASTAMVRALDRLDTHKIAVVSPYKDEDKRRLETFLSGNGFEISNMTGLGLAADEPEALAKMNEETAEDTYRRVVNAYNSETDAVLVVSTNIESIRLIEQMEKDLDCPVVSSNQALYWDSLRLADREPRLDGYGRLLD